MKGMTKIKLNTTVLETYTLLSEGNIGALNVLMQITENGNKYDPYCDPFLVLLALDDLGIYGSRLWQLYKDVCDQSLGRMLAVLRARQLGILSRQALIDAIGTDERRGQPLENFDAILANVVTELPDFKVEAVEAAS